MTRTIPGSVLRALLNPVVDAVYDVVSVARLSSGSGTFLTHQRNSQSPDTIWRCPNR